MAEIYRLDSALSTASSLVIVSAQDWEKLRDGEIISNALMEVDELELAPFSGRDSHALHELANAIAIDMRDVAHIEHDSLLSPSSEVSDCLRQDSLVPMQNPDPPFHQQNRDTVARFLSEVHHDRPAKLSRPGGKNQARRKTRPSWIWGHAASRVDSSAERCRSKSREFDRDAASALVTCLT